MRADRNLYYIAWKASLFWLSLCYLLATKSLGQSLDSACVSANFAVDGGVYADTIEFGGMVHPNSDDWFDRNSGQAGLAMIDSSGTRDLIRLVHRPTYNGFFFR